MTDERAKLIAAINRIENECNIFSDDYTARFVMDLRLIVAAARAQQSAEPVTEGNEAGEQVTHFFEPGGALYDPVTAAEPVTEEEVAEAATRLRAFVREYFNGGCKMMSLGSTCICALCDVDRLARAQPIEPVKLVIKGEVAAMLYKLDLESGVAIENDGLDIFSSAADLIMRLARAQPQVPSNEGACGSAVTPAPDSLIAEIGVELAHWGDMAPGAVRLLQRARDRIVELERDRMLIDAEDAAHIAQLEREAVPREPTTEMAANGLKEWNGHHNGPPFYVRAIWRAMWDAAQAAKAGK